MRTRHWEPAGFRTCFCGLTFNKFATTLILLFVSCLNPVPIVIEMTTGDLQFNVYIPVQINC